MAITTKRALVFNLIVLLVCAVLAGGGYLAGRYSVLLALETDLQHVREGVTYGHYIDDSNREATARAYFDSTDAAKGIDGFAWTVPNVLQPFVGTGPEPGQSNNIFINAYQCRSHRPLRLPKPDGVVRIFATGASVIFGSGASSDERTIGGFLEARLNEELRPETGLEYEVFVLANPGWTSTHERIVIHNRIVELEPDLVITLSGTADINWGRRKHSSLWYRSNSERIFFNLANTVFSMTDFSTMLDVAWPADAIVPPETVAERLAWNVRLAHHALALRGVGYVFFLQPALQLSTKIPSPREAEFVDKNEAEAPYYRDCNDRIRERLRALRLDGFRFEDLTSTFDGLPATDEIFLDSYHFGDRGNQRIAGAMYEVLEPLVRALK